MAKKTEKLQNIVMWHDVDDNIRPYIELFQRTRRAICYDIEERCYEIAENEMATFDTYFNLLPVGRWTEYTGAGEYQLNLEMQGIFSVEVFAVYIESKFPNFETLFEKKYSLTDKELITIEIPQTKRPIVAFRITTFGKTKFYDGYYSATVDETQIRDVNLSIASTTFKKEAFIKKNIAMIKEKLLCKTSELRGHLYVHVVDNGRTLDPEELNSDCLKIYPNPNVGGSGGFARGMMEAMKMSKPQTHVLLMDDDVLLEAESIIRTYRLLRLLKPEYQDCFLSGAMFDYDLRERQYEDIGYVHVQDGSYGPVKHQLDMRWLDNLLENEKLSQKMQENAYAGWWFCCIPMAKIRENGLPLPLFVRGDDVEFSLRNQAKFITMNGICIWHVGFAGKFNAAMELYQVHRNSFVIQAISEICQDVDFLKRIKRMFWQEITRFSYNNAEQLLDSIDDFLKGPEFIMEPHGEQILKEHAGQNEKMMDIEEISKVVQIPDSDPYGYVKLSKLQKAVYVLTINGHLLPNFMLKRKPEAIAYDWKFVPGKNYRRRQLIAMNPGNQTAYIRKIDRSRCFRLVKRYFSVLGKYKREYETIAGKYRTMQKQFVSEEFWQQYLK